MSCVQYMHKNKSGEDIITSIQRARAVRKYFPSTKHKSLIALCSHFSSSHSMPAIQLTPFNKDVFPRDYQLHPRIRAYSSKLMAMDRKNKQTNPRTVSSSFRSLLLNVCLFCRVCFFPPHMCRRPMQERVVLAPGQCVCMCVCVCVCV